MQRLSFHIIAVIISYFLNGCIVVHSQTVCNRPANLEWHLQPQTAQVKWTLMENICDSMVECWGDQERTETQKSDVPPTWNLPQICPLEVQFGVKLFVSIDATLDLYGIRILNVSKEDFESCSTAPQSQDQFVCSDDVMNVSRQVQPKWLLPGLHYFIASHEGNSQLCKLGLRLNVSVKEQQCQSSPLVRLCSGSGVCRTSFWEDGAYRCQCRQHYSGKFCEKFDACLENPCENEGVCVTNGTTDHIHVTYKCLCPPHFTGANCSDVIGRENCDRFCSNGSCLQVSPFSFKCVCYTGHPGPPCGTSCDPNPCQNGGECEESSESAAGYACCSDGTTGPQCRRQRGPCSTSPCHNNASCLVQGEDYVCRCLPGFSGKSCEEIIDYCSLLSVNCLHQGLCLSVIGGYNCLCAPGWIGEFCQYGGNACLIYPDSCMNGATCITTSQPTAPPQYRCICRPHCETEINQCFSNPCLHNGTCLDSVGFYKCRCPPGFLGQKCEVDVDACTLPNTTCPRNTHCLDLPDGLKYTCRLLCPPNIQPCANGGRCVVNNASSYTCVCAPGWAGGNCRLNINDCVQHWCQNGATCVDEIDGYSCLCPRGYSGSYCEMDVDNCIGHHCSEHGVCLDQQSNYTCRCELGFQGSYCEQETDECRSSPCVNGATCEDVIGGYQCHCPPGFEGRWCSENVNDCWSRPCLNGGSCMDLLNGYICHCPFGFQGEDCSVDMDLCSLGTCQERTVTCTETGNGQNVTCICEKGFGGPFCEVNLNDCKSMPCQNGAVCVDGVDLYHCFCPAGKNCSTPVIECASGDRTKCKNGGTCYISAGVVHCTCPPGWGADDCSAPVNQCVLNPCDPEGTLFCEELPYGFKCVCQHGYMGRLCEILISHCVDGLCHRGSKCVDLPRGFKCHCLPGLTGQFCDVNIDDCEEKPCGVLSICKDTVNGYNCFCAPGFIGNNCEVEVNECLSQPCHNGASCSDELNAFSCLCPIGVTGDYCEINIDECLSGPCRHNSTCLDLANGYECVCLPGFTGAGCEFDIDECASSPCKNGATCIDQPGNYHCQCVAPFKGRNCEFLPCEANNPCENGAECVEEPDQVHFPLGFRCRCRRGFTGPRCEINMDECSSNPCLHGFCYDVVDGFYCLCNPGYAGVRCEQDIDDCASNMCSNNSTCRDLHLTYECLCVPGWEGEFCQQEIDECSSQPCLNNATCTDLLNSYQCLCPQGWVGVDCSEDVDECDSGPCLNGAQCQESPLPGEFSCTCPPFFSGPLCNMPFDPCDPAHDPCLHNATCLTRSDGTAACRCQPGFQGTSCEIDTDECISGPCQNQGHCLDRVNSYSCDCEPGFSGRHCEEDINECASRPCQNGGICQDQINRFHCNCPAGYFGTLCDLDINECEVSPCLHEAVCINEPGGFKCVCRPGNAGTWCELSIDECVSNPCQNGGSCVDGPSRYQCLCAGGFMGFHCETNFDECMSGPCLHGRCIDGVDVYYCQCELGWTGARCEMNIDECSSSPCLNGGSCVDLIDKYACFCLDGYTGKNCDIDIDVCLETPTNVTLCLNGGTCLDGQGSSFTCSCPAGFIGDFCEMDVNECCSDPCLHGAICQDLLNGYLCHCRAGWTGLHCELDINECLPQPCNQGMCIQNEPGYGYTCFCRPGFVGRNCEHNYDDCLLQPCPGGSSCVDGINEVSCQPVEGDMSSVPWEPSMTQTPRGSLLTTSPMSPVSPYSEQPTGMERQAQMASLAVSSECVLAGVFSDIFNMSLSQAVGPPCFKETTIVPVPKKNKVKCPNDYRPLHSTRNTYVRMLFIDYSSAFNTIFPSMLDTKLRALGLDTTLCNWILDILKGRPQAVLSKYCGCTIESVLTSCIMAWYENCSIYNRKAIQRVVKTAQYITGTGALQRVVGWWCPVHHWDVAIQRVVKTVHHWDQRVGPSSLGPGPSSGVKTAQYITGTGALQRVVKTAQYITGTVERVVKTQYITGTVALQRVVKTAHHWDITGTSTSLGPCTSLGPPAGGEDGPVHHWDRGPPAGVPSTSLGVKTAQYITGKTALLGGCFPQPIPSISAGHPLQVSTQHISFNYAVQHDNDPKHTARATKEWLHSSYVQYSGNSYLEFEGIDLGANNNITVRFQTQEAQGTILYVDQGAVTRGFFFMKLFIQEGMLQYVFSCNREEGIRRINTSIRVDDGNPYIVYVSCFGVSKYNISSE
ncbi:protein eyes shut homolog [Oncorhynchus masou masou]|uniref:protein eyes shut homolog n=1 Tax=Oncorhynchus masou masou TaxID=90313 RepID=UPI00318351EE